VQLYRTRFQGSIPDISAFVNSSQPDPAQQCVGYIQRPGIDNVKECRVTDVAVRILLTRTQTRWSHELYGQS